MLPRPCRIVWLANFIRPGAVLGGLVGWQCTCPSGGGIWPARLRNAALGGIRRRVLLLALVVLGHRDSSPRDWRVTCYPAAGAITTRRYCRPRPAAGIGAALVRRSAPGTGRATRRSPVSRSPPKRSLTRLQLPRHRARLRPREACPRSRAARRSRAPRQGAHRQDPRRCRRRIRAPRLSLSSSTPAMLRRPYGTFPGNLVYLSPGYPIPAGTTHLAGDRRTGRRLHHQPPADLLGSAFLERFQERSGQHLE